MGSHAEVPQVKPESAIQKTQVHGTRHGVGLAETDDMRH
jgi:hypothetical protein